MFDLINGLPVHPLVVHAVVVLLPLAVIGSVAIAVRPRWRLRHGYLVVAIAALATLLIPISTSSGEALARRVGDPGRHAQLGDQLIWFALPLLALDVALVLAARRGEHTASRPRETSSSISPTRRTLTGVLAALTIVSALATSVQVYRVGDSGARAAWGDKVSASREAP